MKTIGNTKAFRLPGLYFITLAADTCKEGPAFIYRHIKFLGFSNSMDNYEQRKLLIFNQINLLQLIIGLLVPVLGSVLFTKVPPQVWLVAAWPPSVSLLVLTLNAFEQRSAALFSYFIIYPFVTCLVYMNGIDAGINLNFIFFIVLSLFLVQDILIMFFSIGFSMVSFFVLTVLIRNYHIDLADACSPVYFSNQVLSLFFIFYALYLVKKEAGSYQHQIIAKGIDLQEQNIKIERQKAVIAEKAVRLEQQKKEMDELNVFKNKLFSIIAHDLKAPMYALRNLFENIQQHNTTESEFKTVLPHVMSDLNYTTSLMENLLQWAKSQMQAETAVVQHLNISAVANDAIKLLRLQTEAKSQIIVLAAAPEVYALADKDMLQLVLRNLISNAIKFSPRGGNIEVGIAPFKGYVEVYVKDSGRGISADALKKIKQKVFYTTKGTGSETGTGLGLLLCHEFLQKNKSSLTIESEEGTGSIFSFTLPQIAFGPSTV